MVDAGRRGTRGWARRQARGKVSGVRTHGQALDRAVMGTRTRGDKRTDARVDARHVTGACVHACTQKNVRGAWRVQELPSGDWRCTSARTGTRTVTGARLGARVGDGCTVHPRARSSPEMIETT
ncbi:hypothetical protein CRG98_014851 [Punica granatum]|uniref:Uncharacterized protein n=1 Tax=Punica granatum TaxID=22663 RepID=A0A2I0K8B9_PUNGR|nr:hypothetical protein CRG98_014851 [Punica granatum]